MTHREIDRFIADLKANDALRDQAARLQPDKSRGMPLAALVSFAVSKGYGFTVDDATAFASAAKTRAEGKPLTDAELDGVAGGADGLGSEAIYTYFVGVDKDGHLHVGDSPQYAEAVRTVNDTSSEPPGDRKNENWTGVVVTDHGHVGPDTLGGRGHGFQSPRETSTFTLSKDDKD